MRLKRKLENWVGQDLITGHQAESIKKFESQKLQEKLFNSLRFSGYFAILLGIALVIAANWDVFGDYTKLVGHLAVNAVVAGMIWRWRETETRKGYREVAVYMLCGLTLTLLALIGQTFQLQGDIQGLWTLWVALITGMVVIVGQNPRTASLWCLAFAVAIVMNVEVVLDIKPRYLGFFVCFALSTGGILMTYLVARSHTMKRLNPEVSDKLALLCGVGAVLLGGMASMVFYDDIIKGISKLGLSVPVFYLVLLSIMAGVVAMFAFAFKLYPENELIWIFAASSAFMALPFIIPIEWSVLGAVHFIGFMIVLGIIAAKSGHDMLLTLSLFAISVRLFIVFLELFGGMLSTGFGLIIAGLVLTGILKMTLKLNKHIKGVVHAD